jgi:excinuclease UvrABC helicase subunit UvrB
MKRDNVKVKRKSKSALYVMLSTDEIALVRAMAKKQKCTIRDVVRAALFQAKENASRLDKLESAVSDLRRDLGDRNVTVRTPVY